ncbi:ATP-dependent RNA helicase DDX49/DBP8 [Nematocida minor]|uniref:ATP-dependent RNA helicase DDX49/DBP8 n=1 Tax=Nematocida minor TaxID=1912983 RepID=UPI00221EB110|nr:ATP-dependent RNA helicase DDX49/DBP8 [Nematocida minor]KAI5188971.1 ATP-dependent RNA helicase DDX49/DBP8 [Nematocida minor]
MAFSACEKINDILSRIGFKKRTRIQERLLPFTEKRDIMGLSETGTGKTACFVIPLVEELAEDPFGVHSLILTPTRELAMQTKEKVDIIGNYFGIKCEILHGGLDVHKQVALLQKKPHIVIATPGRLAAMLCSEQSILAFKRAKKIVLDEADLLLNGDQALSVHKILSILTERTKNVQLLLFSATDIAPRVLVKVRDRDYKLSARKKQERIASEAGPSDSEHQSQTNSMDEENTENISVKDSDAEKDGNKPDKAPMHIDDIIEKTSCPALWRMIYSRNFYTIDTRVSAVPKSITQEYAFVHRQAKDAYLAGLLMQEYKDAKVMVFMNKADNCAVLSEVLQELGINAVGLSRHTDNKTRHSSFYRFRSGLAKVLLTTDVLSRGLDIKDISCVINYDLPNDFTDYIHRIGRTGRLDQSGYALSFVSAVDVSILQDIQRQTATEMAEKELKPLTTARLMNKIATHREFVTARIEKALSR